VGLLGLLEPVWIGELGGGLGHPCWVMATAATGSVRTATSSVGARPTAIFDRNSAAATAAAVVIARTAFVGVAAGQRIVVAACWGFGRTVEESFGSFVVANDQNCFPKVVVQLGSLVARFDVVAARGSCY
jgi:hypothetical protein